jgi:hypothetical protein
MEGFVTKLKKFNFCLGLLEMGVTDSVKKKGITFVRVNVGEMNSRHPSIPLTASRSAKVVEMPIRIDTE